MFFLVTREDGLPVGQVRYDREGNEAVISVSLEESFRGQGYGSAILRLASRKVMGTLNGGGETLTLRPGDGSILLEPSSM